MNADRDGEEAAEHKRGLWARLWRRPRKRYWLGIPAGGALMLVVGILASGAFVTTLEATNSLAFCTSCHEMGEYIFPEYEESAHYQNASGVRAICSDCHVPHSFFPKVIRKVEATFNELPAKVMGKIGTREKFEAHREEMAERVWAEMRSNDSKACRSCHSYESMELDEQDRYARRKHSADYVEATGKTCIDCHEGIAHELPEAEAAADTADTARTGSGSASPAGGGHEG